MDLIKNSLSILKLQIEENPKRYIFPIQKNPGLIKEIERKHSIFLPASYKEFMKVYDGGFINLLCNMDIDIETAAWNSNTIFSLEEMAFQYERLKTMGWKYDPPSNVNYPFIPFGRNKFNELMIFINPLLKKESYVFEAVHDVPYSCWDLISFDFADFFSSYLDMDGEYSYLPVAENLTLSEYLDNLPYTKLLYFNKK